MFKLEITTNKLAFEDDTAAEVAEILQEVSARVREGFVDTIPHLIRDSNGDTAGTWQYSK